MSGWLKLHRKLKDNPVWLKEPFTHGQAWIDLLLFVAHSESYFYIRNIKVIVKTGQVAMSQITMAKRWQWSRGKVRRFLDELETEQQIVQQNTNLTSLITITNWKEHQIGGTADGTTDGTTDGTHRRMVKNVKNEKKKTKSIVNVKKPFGDFVKLTPTEHEKLVLKIGQSETENIIERMNLHIGSHGKEYKSHYYTALNWLRWDKEKEIKAPSAKDIFND